MSRGNEFIEIVSGDNLDLEEEYMDLGLEEMRSEVQGVRDNQGFVGYEELKKMLGTYPIGNDLKYNIVPESIHVIFDDVKNSEEVSVPHRTFAMGITSEEEVADTGTVYHPAGGLPAEEGALEQLLQNNVHGYADHSEGVDQELLEYAEQ